MAQKADKPLGTQNAVLDLRMRHKDSDLEHRQGLDGQAEDKEHDIGPNEAQTSRSCNGTRVR